MTEGERVMDTLMRYAGPYLRSLDFSGFYRFDDHPRTILPMYGSSYGFFGSDTRLTMLKLRGCFIFSPKSLEEIIKHSPALKRLDLKGVRDADCLTTFNVAKYCPRLASLDISRCSSLRGKDLSFILGLKCLRVLRVAGLTNVAYRLREIGYDLRELEVLDLSDCDLDDDTVGSLVDITEDQIQILDTDIEKVRLKPREAGYEPSSTTTTAFFRRITKIRHLILSGNDRLTDAACHYLAHSVPKLELLELAGIGEELVGEGLVALLKTTPMIKKLDVEDASEIRDEVLEALTVKPASLPLVDYVSTPSVSGASTPVEGVPRLKDQPGQHLTHLILSYASHLSNDAFQALIKASPNLSILELDNTRASQTTIKEFIKASRRRHLPHAEVVAIDCRSVGESLVRDLAVAGMTRTRRGVRGWEERGLGYVDWKDVSASQSPPSSPSSPSPSPSFSPSSNTNTKLNSQHDECDIHRVVFKSFWSWSMVDAVKVIRERERKEREKEMERERKRLAKVGSGNGGGSLTPRWLTLARRGSGFTLSSVPVGNGEASGSGSGSGSGGANGNGTMNGNGTVRQPIQIDLNGDPNLADWDDRGCTIM